MKKFVPRSLVYLALASSVYGFGLDLSDSENQLSDADDDANGRFLILPTTANGLNLNITILAALIASLASALMSLFSLVGLGLLAASKMNDKQKHFHHHSGHHDHGHKHTAHNSHSTSAYRRVSDALNIDWESISITDWLSLMQETWNSFDPTDLECQKRFICDVHQKVKALGPVAKDIVYYFSYLKFGDVMSLPDSLRSLLDEYIDAADRGAILKKDCGDIYSGCNFSVTELIDKYSPHNDTNNYI